MKSEKNQSIINVNSASPGVVEFATRKKKSSTSKKEEAADSWLKKSLKLHRFIGVSLGGGKANKTSVAVIEYFPHQKKIFLSRLIERIKNTESVSADQTLFEEITLMSDKLEFVAFDAPLKLPKCMRCKLKCPGYEICKEPEIRWLRSHYHKMNAEKKPNRSFTPYTERCTESYLKENFPEILQPSQAMGANSAPLAARAMFIARRLKQTCLEVYPRSSLWRIGQSLNIQKSYLKFHKSSVDGEEIRESILKKLVEREVAFLYEDDIRSMIHHGHSFDAFICAMTAMLKYRGLVEKPPRGFPKSEAWIEVPINNLDW